MRFNNLVVAILLVLTGLVSGQFPFGSGFQAPSSPFGTAGGQIPVNANNFRHSVNQGSTPNVNSNGGVLGGNTQRNNQRAGAQANADANYYRTNVPGGNFPSPFKPLNAVGASQQPRRNRFNDAQNYERYLVNRLLRRFPSASSNQGPMGNAPTSSNQPPQLNQNSDLHAFNPLPQSNDAQSLRVSPINRPPVQKFLAASSNQEPMGNEPMFSNQRPQLNRNSDPRTLHPSSESNANREKTNGFVPPQPNIFQQLPPNLMSLLTSILQKPSNFNPGAPNLQRHFPDSLLTNRPVNTNPNQNRNQPEFNAPNPILNSNQGKPQFEDNRRQPEFNRPNPILNSNQGKPQTEDNRNQPEFNRPKPILNSNQVKPQNEDDTGLQSDQMSATSPPDSEHTQSSVVLTETPSEQPKTVTLPAGFLFDLLSDLNVGTIQKSPTNEDLSSKPTDLKTTTSIAPNTVSTTASTTQLGSEDDVSLTTSRPSTSSSSSDINVPESTSEEAYSTVAATFTQSTDIAPASPSADISVPESTSKEPYSTSPGSNAATEDGNELTESTTETDTSLTETNFDDVDETEQPEDCGEDEDWWDCVPLYHNTCDNFARAKARQDFECKPGCFCTDGLLKTSDGQCVEADYCPDPICEDNEEETDCLNQCNTCEANCRPCSLLMCEPGCDCLDGYKRNSNGTCIHASECPVCTT